MTKLIISPYSRALRNGKMNPKNIPDEYWTAIVSGLKSKDVYICQIGVHGEKKIEGVDEFIINQSLKELKKLLDECSIWISIDNFFQHFAWFYGKPGVVIFGQSDPLIFGHPENINLLKDRNYLRKGITQYQTWEEVSRNDDAFISPEEVIKTVMNKL